jgi:hypothetical protein
MMSFATVSFCKLAPRAALIIWPLLLLVACGGHGSEKPSGGLGGGFGPGISIDEALKSKSPGPLLINGWLLLSSQKDIRLCTSLSDSIPPSCGEPSLIVQGLDPTTVGSLKERSGIRWSQEVVQLLGTLKDGVLVVAANTKG